MSPSAAGSQLGVSLWTTDITGVAGYNPGDTPRGDAAGNYTKWFGGTSGATPQVAGLAGLILSVNPELDSNEVQDIIQRTADDKGEPGPDHYYGYGRVNIYNVLLEAIPSKGHIDLDQDYYNSNCTIGIFLADHDLEGQGTQNVYITTSGGDSETVTLTEITPAVGVYRGTISTASGDPNTEDGELQVSDGETITGTYEDEDDGTGNPASSNDTATADCVCPVISNLDFNESPIGPDITVSFETSESTFARVLYGLNCGGPYNTTALSRGCNHTVKLKEASPLNDHYFVVEATDFAGNETVDSNSSYCYRFTTDGPREINVPADFTTIQEAINPLWDGSTITVAAGTYNETVNFKGKGITLRSMDPENWNVVANTIIYSESGLVVSFTNHEDDNSKLMGLTVEGPGEEIGGAGISITSASSPIITNCRITGHVCGVFCEGSYPMVKSNKIFGNLDAGVYCTGYGVPLIENNWIYNNKYWNTAGIKFTDTEFAGIVQNNTIVGNDIGIKRYVNVFVPPEIINCILWSNEDDLNECSLTYSCIQHPEDAEGIGNITGDANNPMFVDHNGDDYHLEANSPCINAGDPNGSYIGQLDFDGRCRVVGNAIDMGADEQDCFPSNYSTYQDWVAMGRPDCWCATTCGSGYQCDGDADGKTEDPNNYRIYQNDLDLVIANWKKTISDPTLNPCADIDHKPQGIPKYRVYINDYNILVTNWKKTDPQLPCNCPRNE